MVELPGLGASYGYASGFVGPLAADRAVKVIERIFVCDDGGFVSEGFVDAAGGSGVDEDFGDFGEGVGIGAESEEFAGAAWTLVVEAKVEHGEVAAVLHDEGIGGETAVARVERGWVGCVERV